MKIHKRVPGVGAAMAVAAVTALASAAPAASAAKAHTASGLTKIGVALTYNNTAFWAAYINYETQYAKQLHIKLLGPLLAGTNASLQNQQIEELVNEGAKAVVVNPETAVSLTPAINYAAKHHVKLVSVDTIVGAGKVYMVVRASNLIYGEDACLEIVHDGITSGDVLDIEGDLSSSNGADRTNGFNACMKANDPGVTILADPTVWVLSTAVSDIQTAINADGTNLKAVYDQYSGPIPATISDLQAKNITEGATGTVVIGDDGVPYEMCDIQKGTETASDSQPANLYAQGALTYALDSAKGVKLKAGDKGIGAPKLANISYSGDTNLGDPIVAPFVTKTLQHLSGKGIAGAPGKVTTTPVSSSTLWGNVYGAAHGGDCSAANA